MSRYARRGRVFVLSAGSISAGETQFVSTTAERSTVPRLSPVDNLKTVLVAWIIVGHALLGYSAVGGWPYDEVNEVTLAPASELVLAVLLGSSGLFVIGVFFFIAGLLAPDALARKGSGRYVRERMLRLGLPWVISALVVWPLSMWLVYRAAGRPVSYWWVFTRRDPLLDAGSLWFVAVLLLYSLAFAAWRGLVRHEPRPPRQLGGHHLVVIGVVVAATTFVVRLWFPARSGQIGDLHLWQWPQCVAMFWLGAAATRHGWAAHVPDRVRRASALVALAAIGLLPVVALSAGVDDLATDIDPFLGGWRWSALATAATEGVLVVAGAVWLLGLAQRRLTRRNRRTSAWARGAYAAFVLQGPVLVLSAVAIRPLAMPAEVKAVLVAAVSVVVCFWVGWLLATHTRLQRIV